MTTGADDREKPAGGNQEQISPQTPRGKRLLKVTLGLALITAVSGVAFVGALIFKYHRIVSAKPGKLLTQLRPGEVGRRVNPFIGTGGYPGSQHCPVDELLASGPKHNEVA